ncbi:uncharacterized protein LOC127055619 isoform X2 [Gopherus flavomarginatus]|uniref:uncharacterized protein LOC127055619 isoform X2 n=1 Tax=Gopherus flavomarginatus TaxID=286002 RepID=UPI0021CBB6B6|nr:uncharacterized protein LOC127055619 isoform X2 [Gopherus flavomarginatus]
MQRCSSSVATKSAVIGLQGIRRYPRIPVQPLCSSVRALLPWPQVTHSLNAPGILKIPFLFAQPGVECNQSVTMPPCSKRAPAWSNGELMDLISVFSEEAVQSQLRSSHRNYDTYGQISKAMMERGHDWDAVQCRVKVKELRSAYCKAREGNRRSGAAPTTCCFYKELDAILGGDPTANPRTTMDSSEQGEEREVEGGKKPRLRVLGWGEIPRSPRRHAARSSSQARRKVASRSSWNLLVKKKQRSGFPVSSFYFQDGNVSGEEGGLWLHACMPRCGIAH